MGIWKKLKKGVAGAPAIVEAATAGPKPDEPRRHHYDFAHRALPQLAFGNVDRFLADLESNPTKLVTGIWAFVGQKVAGMGGPTCRRQR
jgi:hypothetical protein